MIVISSRDEFGIVQARYTLAAPDGQRFRMTKYPRWSSLAAAQNKARHPKSDSSEG
jgi:hypothetical protein